MTKSYIQLNSCNIAIYQRLGKGVPVIFIHGNSLSAKIFERQFEYEKTNHCHFIALDLPGHGDSGKPNNPEKCYSLIGYSDILKELIDYLNLNSCILVGHSLGGHIAMQASSDIQNLLGLMTFGSPPFGIPPEVDKILKTNPAAGLNFKGNLNIKDLDTFANALSSSPANIKLFKELIGLTDQDFRDYIAKSVKSFNYLDEVTIVKNLKIPIAILHGENDSLINDSYYKTLDIPQLWRGQVQMIKKGSHSPQIDNHQDFNIQLSCFINDLCML